MPGAANMARDEALFQSLSSRPVLRLYGWSPPALSLGYFQRSFDPSSLPEPVRSWDRVRRPTGGGAILHDRELTYCVVAPLGTTIAGHPLGSRTIEESYRLFHDVIRRTLAGFGTSTDYATADTGGEKPFFCFDRRASLDLVTPAGKILGSAQRRNRERLLQHGSLVLQSSPHVPGASGFLDGVESGDPGTESRLVESLVRTMETDLEIRLEIDELGEEETELARGFRTQRYEDEDWRLR